MAARRHIVVIDPGTRVPELDCFNRMAQASPLPVTYHLPAMHGTASLSRGVPAGIVILGSGASVYDDEDWQLQLDDWLLPRLDEGVPALGLCYGHQHLAHRLGGEVGFLYDDHLKLKGMRRVGLGADRLWGDACAGELLVSHREVVTALPAGFEVLGQSPEVAIEAFGHPSRPVWGFQAHPEATEAFATNNDVPFDGPAQRLAFGHGLVDAFLRLVERGDP